MTSDYAAQFRQFIVDTLGSAPDEIIDTGARGPVRFRIEGTKSRSSKPGWYTFHSDGVVNGEFADWRDGTRHKWRPDGPSETIDRAQIRRLRAKRQAARAAEIATSLASLQAYWSRCTPIGDSSHAYLKRKRVSATGVRIGSGRPVGLGDEDCLVIPIRSSTDRGTSLQIIRADGERRYWPKAERAGGYALIGRLDDAGPLVFVEGYATGATVYAATGWTVIVALDADNLVTVARWATHRFAGREMFVGADDDTHLVAIGKANKGVESATDAARILGARLVLPDLQGADGTDFNDQAAHYGLDDVRATFEGALGEAQQIGPAEAPDDAGRTPQLPPKTLSDGDAPLPGEIDPAEWADKQAPDRRWIIPGWIIRGAAGLLSGQEGVGKSLLAQQMATSAAAGVAFLGLPIENVRSFYISCEDPLDEMWRRQEAINRALGITMQTLSGRLKLVSLKGHLGNELAVRDTQQHIEPSPRFRQIRASVLSAGANLVFLDNAAHFFDGDENKRHDVAAFLGLIERLAEDIDGAVVLLSHPNKSHAQGNRQGNEYSGSTGWSAHVRNRLFLDWKEADEAGEPIDSDMRLLRKSKSNYGKKGEEIDFRWHSWAFVRPDDIGRDAAADLAKVSIANTENERYLKCLDILTAQKRSTSHSPNAMNYAPRMMVKMTEAAGMKKEAFVRAHERLFSIGAIETDVPLWLGKSRHPVTGIARTRAREGALRSENNSIKSMRDGPREGCAEVRDGD